MLFSDETECRVEKVKSTRGLCGVNNVDVEVDQSRAIGKTRGLLDSTQFFTSWVDDELSRDPHRLDTRLYGLRVESMHNPSYYEQEKALIPAMVSPFLILPILFYSVFSASIRPIYIDREPEKCDLPTYISILPLEYRRELRKIWGVERPRTPEYCARQRRRTEKLIAELPADIRAKIEALTVTTTAAPTETSFLIGLSAEHIHEFNSIMADRSLGVLERSEKLREWAVDLLDMEAMDRLERYALLLERRGDKFREKLRTLSPSAVSVYNRLEVLKLERKAVFHGMSNAIKKELIELWRLKCNQATELLDDERKLACPMDEISMTTEKPEEISTTSTSTSTSTSQTTTVARRSTFKPNRRWRPFPNGIPQLDTESISRMLQKLFTNTK